MSVKTWAEQIADLEATKKSLTETMQTVAKAASEEGRTMNTAEASQFDDAEAQIKQIDADLARVKRLAELDKASAAPVENKHVDEASRALNPAQLKTEKKLDAGVEFTRYAMCQIKSKGNPETAFRLAQRHFADSPRVVETLKAQAEGADLGQIMKAAVAAGSTTNATWAKPLVDYQTFAGDFIEFQRAGSIIGKFGTDGIPALNRIPFNVTIKGQTTGGSANWVGEGKGKPLTKSDYNAVNLGWAKVAAISVLSNELIRFSDPSAELLVRNMLRDAVNERLDIDFINPAKAAVTIVSPASITNGATSIPSSGVDAESIRADLRALWTPFIAARNAPRTAVYIMDSITALTLSQMQNPLGQSEFPGLTMNGGMLLGVPVIVSDYLPRDSGGGIVVLVNANDVYLADDGQVTLDASQEASLEMVDNPTQDSLTGAGAELVSMFQTNSTAFRAERYINWARRRNSGVAYLTGVNWGA